MEKSVFTPDYAAVREQLKKARESAGLSQRGLAVRLDVPHSWVAKVENGERRIDVVEFVWFLSACKHDAIAAFRELLAQFDKPRRRVQKSGRLK